MDPALLFGRGEHPPYHGSCLPPVASTATAEGTRLTVRGAGRREIGGLISYGVCLVGVALISAAAAQHHHSWAPMTRAMSYIVGVGSVLAGSLHQFLIRRRLRRATLVVRPWPIKLEAPTEARFRVFLRGGAPLTSLAAKLECVEEVAIGVGRDARHRHATRYETTLADGAHQAVTAAWSFTVPREYPPSFDVTSNKVVWRLTATVTSDGVDIPVVFTLLVVPEIAA